jgi:hypothetical protein
MSGSGTSMTKFYQQTWPNSTNKHGQVLPTARLLPRGY